MDGLATWAPTDQRVYRESGARLAEQGYQASTVGTGNRAIGTPNMVHIKLPEGLDAVAAEPVAGAAWKRPRNCIEGSPCLLAHTAFYDEVGRH